MSIFSWILAALIMSVTLTGCGGGGGTMPTYNKWLAMSTNATGPRYIVNSTGNPFHLFGMARCQYHSIYWEDLDFGGIDGLCKHFKVRGVNSIRLSISQYRYSDPNDLIVESGGYNKAGIQKFIDTYVDPDVQAIIKNNMYIILDLHMYPPSSENPDDIIQFARDKYIPIWRELAERYKYEPMIAVYELWNEPYPADQGTLSLDKGIVDSGPYAGYDWAASVRQFYIDCANAVREIDTNHILLISDYNAGWGTAWRITWEGYLDQLDPIYKNIVFSVHAAKTHLDTSFVYYEGYWANLASNHNIGLHFGEVETEGNLMTVTGMQNFVYMLDARRNSHHYSSMLWRPHDDERNYTSYWTDFAKGYASSLK